jgi:hypothetical protein
LRALVWTIQGGDMRTSLQQVAGRLNARASQLLWLLVSVDPHRRELALAALDSGGTRPRTAALVTRIDEIVDSDAETLCALAAARANSDILIHARWLEILGRDSVSRRFFRELERIVGSLATSLTPAISEGDSAELALLYVSRLLFLSFLETKGWLDRITAFSATGSPTAWLLVVVTMAGCSIRFSSARSILIRQNDRSAHASSAEFHS